MTEYGLPFDGLLTGDASKAPYSAAEWARQWRLRHGVGTPYPNYGVFKGTGSGNYAALEVLAANPASSNVEVQIGAALVDGRFYETTAVAPLTINANASGNPRIDTVILRLDYVAQTIRLAVKQGTPAGSPSRPTMQQDSTYWEIPLADVAVANGFTTLAQSTITQRQRIVQTSPFGWQPYAYPMTYVHGDATTSAVTLNSGVAAIIPIMLTGNMLLESLSWRGAAGVGLSSSLGWDLYFQDANDGNTAENTLRRVAQSNGVGSGGGGGIVANNTLNALNPTPLSPGVYWLILQNRHATDAYGLRVVAAGTFNQTLFRTKSFAIGGPGQTAEVVTSILSSNTNSPQVRLNGRVFGEAAAF